MLSTRDLSQTQRHIQTESEGLEKDLSCRDHKKAGVAILISEKIDLKTKIIRDKEGHYIMIKGSIQEEDITIVKIYAPNIGAPQHRNTADIKVEIDITQ